MLAFLLLATILYGAIVLIGDLECMEDTILDVWSFNLTYGLWEVTKKLLVCLLGEFAVNKLIRFCDGTYNRVGQIVFVTIFLGCTSEIAFEVFPRLDVCEAPWLHKVFAFVWPTLMMALYVMVSKGDPGVVTNENRDALRCLFPPDDDFFVEKYCDTCQGVRPARAKHCNLNQRCIALFDHNCIWVSNSIGLYNTNVFLAFLAVSSIACIHGFYICARIIYILGLRQWKLIFASCGCTLCTCSTRLAFRTVANEYRTLACLGCFFFICGLTITGFFVSQVKIVCSGFTTYESIKLRARSREERKTLTSRASGYFHLVLLPRYHLRKYHEKHI